MDTYETSISIKALKTTIKSDKFLDLPKDAQLLYIHLWLAQPPAGIVTCVYSLAHMVVVDEERSESAIQLLEMEGFIEPVSEYGYKIHDTFIAEARKDM